MLTFEKFSELNRERCESPQGFEHPVCGWSLSDWMTATVGELGEAANVAKKLNRVRDGIQGNKETEAELRADLADEIADTFIYLDLLAQSQGLSLEAIVVSKFDKTSAKIGYPKRISADAFGFSQAAVDVLRERERQLSGEGFSPEGDSEYRKDELLRAADCYILSATGQKAPAHFWPWAPEWFKPKGRRRDLVRAAALIIADIDRTDNQVSEEG